MKTDKISQQNFTGFTNVICSGLKQGNLHSAALAMKLNNAGSPDLADFRKIKSAYKLTQEEIDKDIIKITYDTRGNKRFMAVDDIVLINGSDKIAPENHNLRSFIAGLTKRISESLNIIRDNGIEDVIFDTAKHFVKKSDNPTYAVNQVLSMQRQTRIKPQQVAKDLNDIISK